MPMFLRFGLCVRCIVRGVQAVAPLSLFITGDLSASLDVTFSGHAGRPDPRQAIPLVLLRKPLGDWADPKIELNSIVVHEAQVARSVISNTTHAFVWLGACLVSMASIGFGALTVLPMLAAEGINCPPMVSIPADGSLGACATGPFYHGDTCRFSGSFLQLLLRLPFLIPWASCSITCIRGAPIGANRTCQDGVWVGTAQTCRECCL